MFAYCRNNPICRIDISGREDFEIYLDDGSDGDSYIDPIDPDDVGAPTPAGPPVGQSHGSGGGAQTPTIQTEAAPGGSYMVVAGDSSEEKHELHHIVERCQKNKSGFTEENIEGYRNKVSIPQSVHRKISGYYSSKTDFSEGQRVRDWLAGQSFDIQQNFGMKILVQMWNEVFGGNGS